ncbi:MAG: hypothetical protein HRT37_17045 [Alteromonadaceae bacterium]|nr:hypothetical protein [Alteromonadaceae bacterium]
MKTLKKYCITCAIFSMLLVVNLKVAIADESSYDSIGGGFNSVFLDKNDEIHLGYGLFVSKKLTTDFYISSQYGQVTKEIVDTDVSLDELRLVVGHIYKLSDSIDINVELGYVSDKLRFRGINADDDGYLIGVKLRSKLSSSVLLWGGVANIEYSEKSHIEVNLGLSYSLTSNTDLLMNFSHSDLKPYSGLFGVRYRF